jgi:AcrR family transcriptional regulator
MTDDTSRSGTRLSAPEREAVAPALRRVPEQARSWRQVEHVIAAAEERLEAGGYDEIASNATALVEASGLPSGSFYTYFTNAEAVLDALRLLWVARFQPMLANAFERPCTDWQDAVDRAIDAVVEFFSYAATRELWLSHQLSRVGLAAERASDARLGDRTVREIEATGSTFEGNAVDRVVFVAILDQLVRLSFLRGTDGRPDPAYIVRARQATKSFVGALIRSAVTVS